jgi:transposase
MIQITAHMKILVAVEPVDFRRGIDGLAAVCRQVLETDPMTGTLFVFCSRRRTAIKCLVYDGANPRRRKPGRSAGPTRRTKTTPVAYV